MPIVDVDGQQIEFPDDMSSDEISSVLQKQFPPQQPNQETPQEPGLLDTTQQGQQQAADLYTSGQQSLPETLLQGAATGADAINKVSGDALSAITPDFIKEPLKRGVNNAVSYLSDTPVGDVARSAIQKYGEFSQDHPRAARDIGALARVGSVLAPFGKVKGVSPVSAALDATGAVAKTAGKAVLNTAMFPIRAPAEIAAQLATRPDLIAEAPKVVELGKKYGVPIGLDDIADSAHYKTLISEGKTLPFAGAGDVTKTQNDAFTRAVSKSIGLDTPNITPEQIDKAFTDIGGKFNSFFDGQKVDLGKDFGLGLRQKDFLDEVGDNYGSDGKATLQKYMGKINSAINKDGNVDGTELGKIRNSVARIARTSGNPEIKGAARDLDNFIVSVSESHSVPSQALDDFRKAKYQYKNLITIEPLAQKDQLRGHINPGLLLGRTRAVWGRNFSKGDAGELGDLANLGQYIKESVPNSGTSQRSATRKLLTGNISAAIPTAVVGGPVGLAAQGGLNLLGLTSNRAIQRLNMSPVKEARYFWKTKLTYKTKSARTQNSMKTKQHKLP